jgi:PDZ domain-containing secreted protein
VATERSGATIFFVPVKDAAAARSVAGKIVLVPVSTYLDAIAYLQRLH